MTEPEKPTHGGGLTLLILIGSIILVIVLYYHGQQMEACDKKGGILVKSGFSNVCVDEKK